MSTPKYKIIHDSINTARQLQTNKFALMKYDVLNKEKELQYSELKRRQTIIIAFFVLILLLFFMYLLQLKHKKDNIKQVYLTETRISKKIHDEVANDVYQVMSKLQGKSSSHEDLLDDLDSIYSNSLQLAEINEITSF